MTVGPWCGRKLRKIAIYSDGILWLAAREPGVVGSPLNEVLELPLTFSLDFTFPFSCFFGNDLMLEQLADIGA